MKDDEVHVWRFHLDCNASDVLGMQQILSSDELTRANRFVFKLDRVRFIMARGMLRIILSRYFEKKPNQLRFNYSSYGKPSLADISGEDMLRFNVSHSHGLAMYAVTRNREVGIDLERIIPGIEFEQIAKQFFSTRENIILREIPKGKARERAFYNCWTRKEAYIKARGEGLSLRLDQFDVSLSPDKPAKLLKHYKHPHEVYRWSLKEIQPAQGYAASLVVEGKNWHLRHFIVNPFTEWLENE
jgi:4'-phosphopantetheinyl transferase